MVHLLPCFLPLAVASAAAVSIRAASANVPPPASCKNTGTQWAYYLNPQSNNNDAGSTTWRPDAFKTMTPNDYNVIDGVGGMTYLCTGTLRPIYNSQKVEPCENYAVNHRAFLYAPQTGSYTFTVSGVDNNVFIWAGDVARSGWTRDNALLNVRLGDSSGNTKSATYTMTAGTYNPYRLMFGNAASTGQFSFSITAPDGTVISDSKDKASPYLVRFSCDNNYKFPNWGNEP